MLTVNQYCRKNFGEKLYKLSLNGGMSCPNRDGTLGTGGCIFCSEGGSGDFTPSAALPIGMQIEDAKRRVSGKYHGSHYIAYFQAFTNTYAPVDYLRRLFTKVITREDIAVLSVATRPDCLGEDVLELLGQLREIKPVWVELGLQTVKPETIRYIRRGYETPVYDEAVKNLNALGIHTVTHVILGLPGEDERDMLKTVEHTVKAGSAGIKLQLLHVLEGTDLAEDYKKGLFEVLSLEEYIGILKKCVALLPEDMVVHRLTGDGPKKILIAPLWSGDKKRVLNAVNRALGL
ncbi:MAG: TIGR01212 family radical SAM protein [Candidatus Limivicinus sp.]